MFYNYFQLFCKELGEDMQSVIDETNLNERSLYNWKNGTKPNLSSIKEIVDRYTKEDFVNQYAHRTNLRELTPRALEIGATAYKLQGLISYAPPDVENLCKYLNITPQEWEKWLQGDIACYKHIEQLAKYFDVNAHWLGSYGGSWADSKTHYFTPYPFEDVAPVDRESDDEKKQREELLHSAITGDKQVVILKTCEGGMQILTSSFDKMELLRGIINLMNLDEFSVDCKLDKYEQDYVNMRNELKKITEQFSKDVKTIMDKH